MELKHSFSVPVSVDRAWDVLLDVERVADCMPGASLDSVDGDDITGKIKVKVGPITQVYAGKAHFTERDREARVVILEASGKETRGSGTASATVRSELTPDGDQTQVTVLTNLNVTGKAAQFGRGVLSEVSGKLVGIFADNMARMLAAEQAGAVTESEVAAAAATADQVAAATEPTGADPEATDGPADTPGTGTVTAGTVAADTFAADAPTAEEPAVDASGAAAPAAREPAAASAAGGSDVDDLANDDLAQPIEELSLPLRAHNSLRREGVHTVADLVARTPAQLLAIDNIGPASVEDIRQRLADRGLSLAPGTEAESAASGTAEATAVAEAVASANGSGAPETAFPARAAEAADRAASVDNVPAVPATSGGGTAPLRPVPALPPESWQPDNDAVDLLSVAGLPVLKRALPVAGGVLALVALILGYLRLRRRNSR